MKKITAIILCLSMLLCLPCSINGQSSTKTVIRDLGSMTAEEYLELKHYTCEYWKVMNPGNVEEEVKIRDYQVYSNGSINPQIASDLPVSFTLQLPEDVAAAMNNGEKIEILVDMDSSHAVLSTIKTKVNTDGTFEVIFNPVFNICKNSTVNSYVSGLRFHIPLVDDKYGYNIYYIYGGGLTRVRGRGWFSEDSPSSVNAPYIHPSVIKNRYGDLKTGFTILAGETAVSSKGHTIGKTGSTTVLYNAWPVLLVFRYPMTISFRGLSTEAAEPEEEKTDEPDKTGENNETGNDGESADNKGSGDSGNNGEDPGSGSGGSGSSENSDSGGSGGSVPSTDEDQENGDSGSGDGSGDDDGGSSGVPATDRDQDGEESGNSETGSGSGSGRLKLHRYW